RLLARDARELERRERCRRVASIVLARNSQLELDRLELVATHVGGRLGQPALEQVAHLPFGGKGHVMVELDVRHYGDLWAEELERAVGLVSLGDEPALPRAGVPAELGNLAADQEGRIRAEPVEAEGDHSGGGRLAVRAGDYDRLPQPDQLGEQLAAPLHVAAEIGG